MNRITELERAIRQEVGSSTWDMISELIRLKVEDNRANHRKAFKNTMKIINKA